MNSDAPSIPRRCLIADVPAPQDLRSDEVSYAVGGGQSPVAVSGVIARSRPVPMSQFWSDLFADRSVDHLASNVTRRRSEWSSMWAAAAVRSVKG